MAAVKRGPVTPIPTVPVRRGAAVQVVGAGVTAVFPPAGVGVAVAAQAKYESDFEALTKKVEEYRRESHSQWEAIQKWIQRDFYPTRLECEKMEATFESTSSSSAEFCKIVPQGKAYVRLLGGFVASSGTTAGNIITLRGLEDDGSTWHNVMPFVLPANSSVQIGPFPWGWKMHRGFDAGTLGTARMGDGNTATIELYSTSLTGTAYGCLIYVEDLL